MSKFSGLGRKLPRLPLKRSAVFFDVNTKGSVDSNMADTTRFVPEHRRQAHKGKNLFKGDELRRRREEQQVEIRKQKKEENIAKRRNLFSVNADAPMESDTDEDTSTDGEKVCILAFL
jgi:Importin beta binding domain